MVQQTDDEADASFLAERINLLVKYRDAGYNPTLLIRRDIDVVWDKRRHGQRRNRPRNSWWSPQAIDRATEPGGTVGDHIIPMKNIVERILTIADDKPLTGPDLLPYLEIPMAVITTEENARLSIAGLSRSMPAEWSWDLFERDRDTSIWARYNTAGLDVSLFRRFDGDPDEAPPGYPRQGR